jgi:hypothetical protein
MYVRLLIRGIEMTSIKKFLSILTVVVVAFTAPLVASSSLLLTNPSLTPAPLEPVESNGEGNISFGLVENLNGVAPATDLFGDPNVQISIEFSNVKLKNDDINLITGSMLTYFDINYTIATGDLRFLQKADIPAQASMSINIPFVVTMNTVAGGNERNGFNANISAGDVDTIADSAAAEFTFTQASIVANDDNGTVNGRTGGIAVGNVTDNDTLNGSPVVLGTNVQITAVTDNTPLVVNTTTGMVTVPANTPAGTYVETYTLCKIGDPSSCSDANVTVIVTAAPIVATDDNGTAEGVPGGVAVADITDNDTLNGVGFTLGTEVNITTVTNNTRLEVNTTTGEVYVPADTPAGTYIETYTICENLNPSNCDDANITVVVTALLITANDDNGTVNGKTGGTAIADILDNDTLGLALGLSTADVNITVTTDIPELVVNTTTGAVTVPANTPAGTYVEVYRICEQLNPGNCDDANITVIVTAAPIVANNDNGTVSGLTGGTAIVNITTNDTLNGTGFTLGTDVNITAVTNNTPLVVNTTTGQVTVPGNTTAGTYMETYTICENLNPSNCDDANITVIVSAATPDYRPSLYARGTIVNGAEGNVSLVIRIGEYINGTNSAGDLVVVIAKNTNLSLTFDANETSRDSRSIDNSDWAYSETPTFYKFTYNANGKIFPGQTASFIGVAGVFTSPTQASGQFLIEVTIFQGTGETNLVNNKDNEKLEYSNAQ